jgi:hypothetical protein
VNSLKNTIPDLILKLSMKSGRHEAFLGFDACIDVLVRIVKDKKDNEITGYFTDSSQFGNFLSGLDNKSCGLELHTKLSKIGGNMVITSNALGNLGVDVDCVGTFGFPEILPVFRSMSANCSLLTIGETITATALEFNNSKVIMFDPGPYNNLTWEDMRDLIGTDSLRKMIAGKQLVSFLNWSEIDNSSDIWEGVLKEIMPGIEKNDYKPYFFSDISDCSRKSKNEILRAVDLLGRFREFFNVSLSLNQNEAGLVAKALDFKQGDDDEAFVKQLWRLLDVDTLIIHRTKDAIACDGKSVAKCDTFFCEEPKILTGGGDNFNAGFCYALLKNLTLFESLIVANAVSGSYVKNGLSPDSNDLLAFLKQYSAE